MRAIYKLSSISCACLSIEAYQPILSANNYCDFKAYGAFSNVMLTENEYESFCREYRNAEHVLNNLSLYMEANGVSYSNDYAELLIFAKKDGIENVGDIENISGNGNLNDVQKELYWANSVAKCRPLSSKRAWASTPAGRARQAKSASSSLKDFCTCAARWSR